MPQVKKNTLTQTSVPKRQHIRSLLITVVIGSTFEYENITGNEVLVIRRL